MRLTILSAPTVASLARCGLHACRKEARLVVLLLQEIDVTYQETSMEEKPFPGLRHAIDRRVQVLEISGGSTLSMLCVVELPQDDDVTPRRTEGNCCFSCRRPVISLQILASLFAATYSKATCTSV